MTGPVKLLRRSLLVAASLAIAAGAAQAQDFKLRWGHYLPNSPFVQVEKDFAEKIKERTNGRVEIEITFAGGLGKGNELGLLAGRGAVDMAAIPPGYYPDQLLFWKAYQIPFIFADPVQAMDVLQKSYKQFPIFQQEVDKMRVHYLFEQPLGSYYLTGPSPDCTSIDSLKGKKIRSFGADIPKMHDAIGAVPVTISPTEVYEALQRGTIDYSFLNAGNIESLRLFEPAKYNCGPIITITGHMIIVGQRTWDRLPPDIQEIFTDQAAKSQQDYLEWVMEGDKASIAAIEKAGGQFTPMPDAELAKWKEATPDLLEAWANDVGERGFEDEASEVAKAWREWTKSE
jgi:TRAP-type transport system periplasmic protein